MSEALETLTAAAMNLSTDDKLVLVTQIWESIAGEEIHDKEAIAIASQRAAEFDAGLDVGVSYESVKMSMRQVLDETSLSQTG